MMPRDPVEQRVAPNLALEGVLTRVRDARDRLAIDAGRGQYVAPWDDPWGQMLGTDHSKAALEWVIGLLEEARHR